MTKLQKQYIFSRNLKNERAAKNWTQREAAEKIGVSISRYGAWEEGRSLPRPWDMVKIEKVFTVSLETMLKT